ncbi:hypothetical protein Ae168Ps1_1669 [Pseudonocardia sp. Ae168_Ps1]|nr:hypothetical protein Ae150APs1_1663 [Pseudonocardia sp. Ae150A_Ps1]OLL79263.1 hypothetical protein Ae168Ps1_1669 [Pseudonocardia sp. Ae168_Ps1]OLL86599.1 hypothetical protein Ae263Ps1_3654c [Pseudonocardia sp. Ae263_Ps1]OLL93353.1 hypothetical protein Ae356Ps1_3250 [Pseudonocardia sp. Ae356_Ps1]
MHEDDVGHVPRPVEATEHAHHRGDAAARGDEQQRAGRLGGQGEVAGRLLQLDDRADRQVADEPGGDDAVRDLLDGDRQVVRVLGRGQRVAPPVPDAVDVDPDADVLPGPVPGPAAARLDGDRDGASGLPATGDDPAAQGRGRPQRVEQGQEVLGQQRRGQRSRGGQQAPGQCRRRDGGSEHDINSAQLDVT